MGAAGVQTLRASFKWSDIETLRPQGAGCGTAVYDWADHDRLVSAAGEHGIRLMPLIVGSPAYAASKQSEPPRLWKPRVAHSYRCFVRALVGRYGTGGRYVDGALEGSDSDAAPIAEWQVWNEPNVPYYAVKVRPRNYGRLLQVTHAQIASVDPRGRVITAGGPESPLEGMPWPRFVRAVFRRVPGVGRSVDALAVHPYGEDAAGVRKILARIDRVKRAVGEARTPLWITEVGWASEGPFWQFPVKSAKGQADELTKTFRMLAATRARFQLGTVHWYNWRDKLDSADGGRWHDYAGLYTSAGSPKPACRRFASLAGGECPHL